MNNRFHLCLLTCMLSVINFGLYAEQGVVSVNLFNGGDGSKSSPFSIINAEQLNAVRNYLGFKGEDKYFRMDADIDLDQLNNGYWEPIGNKGEETSFRGKFDGNKKKIFNLRIGRQGAFYQYTGFFGCISDGAEISNLYIESGKIIGATVISGNTYTGAFVGYVSSNDGICIIDSCVNRISVTGGSTTGMGSSYTGGICGYAVAGILGRGNIKITSCLNTGFVFGYNDANSSFTGGVCGQALASASLHQVDKPSNYTSSVDIAFCTNIGKITGGLARSSASATGGICGYLSGFGSGYSGFNGIGTANITTCVNSGHVIGGEAFGLSDSYVGGILGYQSGNGSINSRGVSTIESCINNGWIIGNDDNIVSCTGGISGFSGGFSFLSATGDFSIAGNYSKTLIRSVSEGHSIGGISGRAIGSDVSFANNYWQNEDATNISLNGVGEKPESLIINDRNIMLLNESELISQASFKEWSFGDNWKIWEKVSAPYLFYQSSPLNIRYEKTDELDCSSLSGSIIDSIVIHKNSITESVPFKTLKNIKENRFIADINGVSSGDVLQLVSYERGKMPSNPQRISITHGTSIEAKKLNNNIFIYPNPVSSGNDINIYIHQEEHISYKRLYLFDMKGNLHDTQEIKGVNIKLTAPVVRGIFILQIVDEEEKNEQYKLIVR